MANVIYHLSRLCSQQLLRKIAENEPPMYISPCYVSTKLDIAQLFLTQVPVIELRKL